LALAMVQAQQDWIDWGYLLLSLFVQWNLLTSVRHDLPACAAPVPLSVAAQACALFGPGAGRNVFRFSYLPTGY